MDNILKTEILKYENKLFNDYIRGRNKLVRIIKNVDFDSLNNNQLIILINDLKEITESVKETCENIDYFSLNNSKKFKMNNTLKNKEDLIKLVCVFSYLFNNNCFLNNLGLTLGGGGVESDSTDSELLSNNESESTDSQSLSNEESDSDSDE